MFPGELLNVAAVQVAKPERAGHMLETNSEELHQTQMRLLDKAGTLCC
jgi:hypothetical protein